MEGPPAELSSGARERAEPWIVEHPQFKEMMALDVADSTQVYAAFLVYMDLLEVRNWNNVQILSSLDLCIIYLSGKEKEDTAPQVVIPTPVSVCCSHERIQHYLKLNPAAEKDENSPRSVLLAIVETDSTIVYYKLTDGFVVPDPPDFVDDVDNKRWKKRKMKSLR